MQPILSRSLVCLLHCPARAPLLCLSLNSHLPTTRPASRVPNTRSCASQITRLQNFGGLWPSSREVYMGQRRPGPGRGHELKSK